jgi:chemotaxis response regulator CheB
MFFPVSLRRPGGWRTCRQTEGLRYTAKPHQMTFDYFSMANRDIVVIGASAGGIPGTK